jgi:hypothetical protein
MDKFTFNLPQKGFCEPETSQNSGAKSLLKIGEECFRVQGLWLKYGTLIECRLIVTQ